MGFFSNLIQPALMAKVHDSAKRARHRIPVSRLLLVGALGASAAYAADDPRRMLLEDARQALRREDLPAAMAVFRKLSEGGYGPAQAEYATLLDAANRDEEAVAWYRKAAAQGAPEGEYGLGLMYIKGEGVKRDPAAGFTWFLRAAERNYGPALREVATAYETGELNVVQDEQKAVAWLRRAAERGERWAVTRLAQAYRQGQLGLPVDPAKAAEVESKAGF